MTLQSIDRSPPLTVTPVEEIPPPNSEERFNIWPFVWVIFAFKFITLFATWWYAARSSEATTILAATHWFWLFIPMIAIGGPLAFHYRLRRVRRKRAQLQASEWMVGELRDTR